MLHLYNVHKEFMHIYYAQLKTAQDESLEVCAETREWITTAVKPDVDQ